VLGRALPAHPGRRPDGAGHPVPADLVGKTPAAIVVGSPAEGLITGFGLSFIPMSDCPSREPKN
jgi:hypothetical protein